MAKAILGHVGGVDPRMLAEIAVLRRRVRELQAEVERLSAENAALLSVDAMPEEIISLDAAHAERSTPALA
jgi:hypothetical protein